MKQEKIKPIPKYIQKRIYQQDKLNCPEQKGYTRFYAYFTKNDGELVKITVAVKTRYKQWYCKQVAVHGVHSAVCFVKDMEYARLAGYMVGWHDVCPAARQPWYEDGNWYEAEDKLYDPFALPINLDYILRQKEYKYSAVDKLKTTDILKYLRLYEQYPEGEYLLKLGLAQYATSKTILRRLHCDIKFRKWLIQHKTELINKEYYAITLLHAYSHNKTCTQVQQEAKNKMALRDNCYKDIRELFAGHYERFFSYLAKQQINLVTYKDYFNACLFLGLNMNEDKNRLPHDFKRWHDIRIDEYHSKQAELNAEKRKKLYEQFASIANKYAPLAKKDEVYIVMIAQSPAELTLEGEALHHCVGKMGYDQRFANETSLIFFVRLATQPDVPLATLEYSLQDKKILQCYGDNDSKPQDELLNFVNKNWLPYANRKLRKIQKVA